MKSRMKAEHYISDEIFLQEKKTIFRDLWIFACFKSAVDVHQAYVTREIAGISVFIQNNNGVIEAFENSCPHRQMPIFSGEFGQDRAVCPYHGWVFDREYVKSIPKEIELYQYSAEQRQKLCLNKFSIQIIGGLIFICLAKIPPPIETQFNDEFLAKIKEASDSFGSVAVHLNIKAKYNWKLNFENVLDHNHIPYIHPKTFSPIIIKGKGKCESGTFFPSPSGAIVDQSFHATTDIKIEPLSWHALTMRGAASATYENFFIFPNVNFISIGGVVFLLQQFHPISASETQVRLTLCAAREKQRIPALPAILRGHMREEVAVLHEDVAYLEALQSRLHSGSHSAEHGAYEFRLQSFAEAYLNILNLK